MGDLGKRVNTEKYKRKVKKVPDKHFDKQNINFYSSNFNIFFSYSFMYFQ